MALELGISFAEINPSQYNDGVTGKPLRAVTVDELDLFNKDLTSIAAQYASEPIRAALAKNQREALVLARAVMYAASQPYKGAYAVGDEICMRLICPVDMAYTIEEIWDLNLSAETVGDIWGTQTGGTTPADDTMGEEEGNIIVGFTNPVPLPGLAKYQFIKGGKTFPYFPLQYNIARADSLPFVEVLAPLLEFPEETVRIQCDVGRAIAVDRTQPVGLHFCRASAIRAATGSA